MFGEFIPFHNSGICFRTTSLYLPMSHLSSKLIWTRSLCGEDIHSLISCLCAPWINIICQCSFCNHIVWLCLSFHRLNNNLCKIFRSFRTIREVSGRRVEKKRNGLEVEVLICRRNTGCCSNCNSAYGRMPFNKRYLNVVVHCASVWSKQKRKSFN